ncbi:MAG: hypothetical protein KA165_16060 [Saprospiraceae bacterium]|nr:hypothetical protein [Saprospiraceae bacterium]
MWKNIFFSVVLFFLLSTGIVTCMMLRSCAPTYFKPVDVTVLPLVWSGNTCAADTTGSFEKGQEVGFALHFDNEYVAEAAMEPGILGVADTLTAFSVFIVNPTGGIEEVTEQFFYGLPDECEVVAGLGNSGFKWVFCLPDGKVGRATLQGFSQHFNQIRNERKGNSDFPDTGLDVEHSLFTFWAKSILFAQETLPSELLIRIETASGKKWNKSVRYRLNELLLSRPQPCNPATL